MGDKSSIEWTDATWNVFRGLVGKWACTRVSPGCDYCYAARLNVRFGGPEYGSGAKLNDVLRLDEKALTQPLRWQAPRMVFVHSMTDTFHEAVPEAWLDRLFAVMALATQHTFQVLTKRPRRMKEYLSDAATPDRIDAQMATIAEPRGWCRDEADVWPLPNVWLGVSVELDRYSWRANVLRDAPAASRFISAEPLLGPLDTLDLAGIDWLIVGGESGSVPQRSLVEARAGEPWRPKAEALRWVQDLRDRATASGTAFFFKQWGGHTPKTGGRLLDGRTWDEYPTVRDLAVAR